MKRRDPEPPIIGMKGFKERVEADLGPEGLEYLRKHPQGSSHRDPIEEERWEAIERLMPKRTYTGDPFESLEEALPPEEVIQKEIIRHCKTIPIGVTAAIRLFAEGARDIDTIDQAAKDLLSQIDRS